MDDRSLVGGDGVGSMFERGADMVNRWLPVFDIEGRGFKDHVGTGRVQPVVIARALLSPNSRECIRTARTQKSGHVKASGVHPPADAPGSDARYLPLDTILLAQFGVLFLQKLDQRAIDVAESEEPETKNFHECESISSALDSSGALPRKRKRRLRTSGSVSCCRAAIYLTSYRCLRTAIDSVM